MSENTLPNIAPLIDLLKYSVNNPIFQKPLLGTSLDLQSLCDHTKSFLKQLIEIKESLLPPITPVTQQEYMEEVKRIREATFSGTSGTTPEMVKTEALNPELKEIGSL